MARIALAAFNLMWWRKLWVGLPKSLQVEASRSLTDDKRKTNERPTKKP